MPLVDARCWTTGRGLWPVCGPVAVPGRWTALRENKKGPQRQGWLRLFQMLLLLLLMMMMMLLLLLLMMMMKKKMKMKMEVIGMKSHEGWKGSPGAAPQLPEVQGPETVDQ